jgi:hypothetical protein
MATQMRGFGHNLPQHSLHPTQAYSILPCTQTLRHNYSLQYHAHPYAIIHSQPLLPSLSQPLHHHQEPKDRLVSSKHNQRLNPRGKVFLTPPRMR